MKITVMHDFIEMVQEAGYRALFLENGANEGYQARVEGDCIRAIVHTEDRRTFVAITVPLAIVQDQDVYALRKLIEGRLALMEVTE